MENEDKECSRCEYWDRYYTKGVTEYTRIPYGWCNVKQKDVRGHGSCEEYAKKYSCGLQTGALKIYINNVLREITSIRKMIEEDENEKQL